MKAYLINMHLLVPRSRSSAKVKVKYKGYISQKNGHFGGIRVSQTVLVSVFFFLVEVIFNLPEHEVLRVSFCDDAVSDVHRATSTFCLVYALEATFSMQLS